MGSMRVSNALWGTNIEGRYVLCIAPLFSHYPTIKSGTDNLSREGHFKNLNYFIRL
jgi:hypothetical protein